VYFVPLAPVRQAGVVVEAIARAIGVREQVGQDLLETLAAALRERAILLVLDNFEHVLSATADVAELVASAVRLKVLLTSRVVLGRDIAEEYVVPPLHLNPGVELFVDHARSVRPGLVLDADSTRVVEAICARVDCLPLAIELVAARVELFDPLALLERLERRLPMLASGLPDRPARQQTLRATLGWSYGLLEPPHQELLARLGAFVGTFDVEAAERVCSPPGDDGLSVAAGLDALIDASLVRRVEQPGAVRYEMLETIREYAAERLGMEPYRSATHQRHAEHFMWLAETADAELGGPRMDAWLARLAVDHPNVRAALTRLAESAQIELGLRLGAAMWRFWQVRGHMSEGRGWLDRFLDVPDPQPSRARARALVGSGALAWRQQDTLHASERLLDAVAVCRVVDERAGLATALKHLALVALYARPPEFGEAERLLTESLGLRRALADRDGMASCLNDLAVIALRRRQYAEARPLLVESQALCRELGNSYGLSFVLNNLSFIALADDDFDAAGRLLREGLQLARELGSTESVGCALNGMACLAAVQLQPLTAARLLGASEALRETIGVTLSDIERETYERHLALARASVAPDAWQAAMEHGRNEALDAIVEDVLQSTPSL